VLVITSSNLFAGDNKVKPTQDAIPGYTFGSKELAKSPVTLADLELLKKTVLFTAEDEAALKQAGAVLGDQVDAILDLWYGYVASHEHLVYYFTGADSKPDPAYLSAVRSRFGQWILDTCNPPYDQKWLDYQYEIALRHHRSKKNQTDGVKSVGQINQRYLVAFIYPITATIKPFLAKKGHNAEEVERMYQAWFKSVVMQVTLWSLPYVKDGEF
jgi:hypothetical protein